MTTTCVRNVLKRRQVPENTKFSKDVILAILKASTVFINYLGTHGYISSAYRVC